MFSPSYFLSFLLHKEAEAQSGPWIYIFLFPYFQPHSTLGGKVKEHRREEAGRVLSVSHLATA